MAKAEWARRSVPSAALAVAISVLTVYAVLATGHQVQRLDLNNSGIWATRNDRGSFGRLLKSASTQDTAVSPPAGVPQGHLDVLQDGNAVVGLSDNTLIPLDTAAGAPLKDALLPLPTSAQLDMRGGTLAALDPATGKIWATRFDRSAATVEINGLDPSGKPVAEIGAPAGGLPTDRAAALSVGEDGSIHAVSASGRAVRVLVDGEVFQAPEYTNLSPLTSVQVAALGSRSVTLDAATGSLILPGGRTLQIPGISPDALLQQGGADSESVVLATGTSLLSVALGDGTVTPLYEGAKGTPAQPVQLKLGKQATGRSCLYAAWAGSPSALVSVCSGDQPVTHPIDRGPASDLVFRVNWNLLVLNDRRDGWIYDIDLDQRVDDWPAPAKKNNEDDQEQENQTAKPSDAKPLAKPDKYGARPGHTSILHVLDNDQDPGGNVLSIVAIPTKPGRGATAEISPDGQTIRFHQPADGGSTTFRYRISNGSRNQADGTVEITARADADSDPPHLRFQAETNPTSYAVISEGTVTMPVLADWRDDEGDPMVVTLAKGTGGQANVTPDGQIEFTADRSRKTLTRTIAYQVSDGTGAPQDGQVEVVVVGEDEDQGRAPVAAADAVRGEVGTPITVLPLANDIPGVDVVNADTRLNLAEDVHQNGLEIETDRESGRVTIKAKQPRTYFLDYTAKYGNAPTASARIRVDVVDKRDEGVVAMPDQAVIRGQAPVLVDVLANDADPAGGLLTVQTAQPQPRYADQVQVAVVKGRWVHITPKEPRLNPQSQVVTYEVTNGQGKPVTGDITITQWPELAKDRPLLRGDEAVVRAGDSTLVPVLANDTSLSGAPLTLATTNDAGLPAGRLPVIGDQDGAEVGQAFVSGDYVRYVAPATVDGSQQVTIEYDATCATCNTARGRIEVTIKPEQGEKNSPPAPQSIEMRAVSGDTITIPVPSSGQDPDGDSVSLVGIASAPKLGRILAVTPKGITYQAYPTPDSVGTDSFSYTVGDRYGGTGNGRIRVAVVPPGQTQVPVALDDTIIAQPGARVTVGVLANDLTAQSDKVTIRPLTETNSSVPAGVELDGERERISANAPGADAAEPLTFSYGLVGNGGTGNTARITVKQQDGYLNPPRIHDDVAVVSADGKTASVDALAKAWDPDGDKAGLQVTAVAGGQATIAGGTISVPVLPRPQVLSYEVTDGDGAQASALVYVPAVGDGLPYVQGEIKLDRDGTATVALADYVVSPRAGRQVTITRTDSVIRSPKDHLQAAAGKDLASVQLETSDYTGPASISLEVTDATGPDDPDRRVTVVTVPVQIGPETPVLRCPEDPQVVQAGTRGKALDLASLCHLWTPTAVDPATLTFSAAWATPVDKVTPAISDDQRAVTLEAHGEARPDSTGTLEIGIPGTQADPQPLTVVVKAAPPPKLAPITRPEVRQGTKVSGKIKLNTDLVIGRQDTIVSMTLKSEEPNFGTFDTEGVDGWWVAPSPTFDGRLVFTLTFSDVADITRTDRQRSTTLTVTVYGKPDKPEPPVGGKTVQSRAVSLSWPEPEDNGATIEKYEISSDTAPGGPWTSRSRTYTINGLTNGVKVQFRVRAVNKAGPSDWSDASDWIEPNQVPSRVTGFTASNPRDGEITLTWNAVSGQFTPVMHYLVAAGGAAPKKYTGTTATMRGLANVDTTFSIWAVNKLGKSKAAATTTGWPSGQPGAFSIGTIEAKNLNADRSSVGIDWAAAHPNGEGPVTYSVTRDGSAVGGCQDITATQCTDGGVNLDGTTHSYQVTATNKPALYPRDSPSKSWNATGRPEAPGKPTASATGENGMVKVTGTVGNARGVGATVKVSSDNSSDTVSVPSTGGPYQTVINAGSNGSSHDIVVELCNSEGLCTKGTGSASVIPFGPLEAPSINAANDATQVWASATGNGNGRKAKLVITSTDGHHVESAPSSGELSLSTPHFPVGPSHSTTFTVQLVDVEASRATKSAQSSPVRTPDPPPPQPTVSISKGGSAQGQPGCSTTSCAYVLVTTRNFSGSYTCTWWGGNGGDWASKAYAGDKTDAAYAYYGYPNTQVHVTCGGVQSNTINW